MFVSHLKISDIQGVIIVANISTNIVFGQHITQHIGRCSLDDNTLKRKKKNFVQQIHEVPTECTNVQLAVDTKVLAKISSHVSRFETCNIREYFLSSLSVF